MKFYERTLDPKWKYRTICEVSAWIKNDEKDNERAVFMWSEEKIIAVYQDRLLTIFPHYAFDGATGAPDLKKGMRSFVIHDLICQFQCVEDFRRLVSTRANGDRLMRRMMIDAGVSRPVAWAYFLAVRLAGLLPPKQHTGLDVTISKR